MIAPTNSAIAKTLSFQLCIRVLLVRLLLVSISNNEIAPGFAQKSFPAAVRCDWVFHAFSNRSGSERRPIGIKPICLSNEYMKQLKLTNVVVLVIREAFFNRHIRQKQTPDFPVLQVRLETLAPTGLISARTHLDQIQVCDHPRIARLDRRDLRSGGPCVLAENQHRRRAAPGRNWVAIHRDGLSATF